MRLSTLGRLGAALAFAILATPLASAQVSRPAPSSDGTMLLAPRRSPAPSVDLNIDSDPFALRAGGPDAFGYTYKDSNEAASSTTPVYAWVDISATSTTPGTVATAAASDDGTAMAVPIGFSFPFYGATYTTININANGFASFSAITTSTPYTNEVIPSSTNPNQVLAPFWDDLHLSRSGAGSTVRYLKLADGRFVISWINAKLYNPTTNTSDLDFQVILEPDGDIVFQYQSVTQGNATSTLASATTGIEGSGAVGQGIQVNKDAAGYILPNLAIQFSAPVATPAAFASTTTQFQNTGAVLQNQEQFVLGANVVVSGTAGTTPLTSITFSTAGTTDPADLAQARLLYTGSSTSYSLATSPVFGSPVVSPSGTLTFTGSQALPPGNNYFLLVYKTTPTATIGNLIDATYEGATVGGTARLPTVTTLAGAVTIVVQPVNDNLANAKVVTATPYSDTQSNAGAGSQTSENAATCTDGGTGFDGFNSIWYVYTPSVSGSMTTTSNGFDTIHAVYTGTTFPLTQVGCADLQAAGTAETVTVSVTAGTKYYIRVTGYAGDSGTATVTVTGPAPVAPFTLSPTAAQTITVTGACTETTSQTRSFTVTNNGSTPFTITGAALTGGTGFSVNTSGLPVTLAVGQSVSLVVTFAPAVGQTGTTSTAFTVNYNDGTDRTSAAVTINATATDANLAAGTGGGYAYRNNVAACTATSPAATPGTTFIPASTHTPITAWTSGSADDGTFTVPPGTLASLIEGGSVRFFGRNYTSLFISSNGYVTLGAADAGGTSTNSLTLPTTTGAGMIAAAAQDLNLNQTTYTNDGAGVLGKPNVRFGSADVNGDGKNEMVVTWWHAYDYGSTSYPLGTAVYHTFQLVIYDGGAPNVEDRFEVRFPGGNDANNIPYSQNATAAGIAGELVTGISNPAGTVASVYRTNTTGGPYSPGLGVTFQAETQATTAATPGYRLMGVPVTGFTVARLADLNLVQGIAAGTPAASFPEQYPNAAPNLYTSYTTAGYTRPTSTSVVIAPGTGFFWQLYNRDIDSGTVPAQNGTGTSDSFVLPMPLQGTGVESTTDVAVAFTAGEPFAMIANPFRAGLQVATTDVATWEVGGNLASRVLQAWDPVAMTYVPANILPTPDLASAWQGFFVENNTTGGVTSLSIKLADRVTAGGTFVGRTAPALLAFELAGSDAATGMPTLDRAATLALDSLAVDGWDPADASKLAPLAAAYATVGFQGEGPDGAPRVKAQDSRSRDAESFDVPLVVDAVGTNSSLTLSWAGLDALPEGWAFELRDVVTGQTVDLRTVESYTFEQTATPARPDTENLIAATTTAAQAKAGDAPRFVLHVTTGRATATEPDAPTVFALAAPAPNPTAATATFTFDVPTASDVTVSVYDLLGRRVATLAQGQTAAGRHTARLDAGAFAPGVYVVRMSTGTFTATRRLTVVR